MAHTHAVAKTMDHAEWKNFGRPDEIREFPKGRIELISIGGASIIAPSSELTSIPATSRAVPAKRSSPARRPSSSTVPSQRSFSSK